MTQAFDNRIGTSDFRRLRNQAPPRTVSCRHGRLGRCLHRQKIDVISQTFDEIFKLINRSGSGNERNVVLFQNNIFIVLRSRQLG